MTIVIYGYDLRTFNSWFYYALEQKLYEMGRKGISSKILFFI